MDGSREVDTSRMEQPESNPVSAWDLMKEEIRILEKRLDGLDGESKEYTDTVFFLSEFGRVGKRLTDLGGLRSNAAQQGETDESILDLEAIKALIVVEERRAELLGRVVASSNVYPDFSVRTLIQGLMSETEVEQDRIWPSMKKAKRDEGGGVNKDWSRLDLDRAIYLEMQISYGKYRGEVATGRGRSDSWETHGESRPIIRKEPGWLEMIKSKAQKLAEEMKDPKERERAGEAARREAVLIYANPGIMINALQYIERGESTVHMSEEERIGRISRLNMESLGRALMEEFEIDELDGPEITRIEDEWKREMHRPLESKQREKIWEAIYGITKLMYGVVD